MIPFPPAVDVPLPEMVFPLMVLPEDPRTVMPERPLPRGAMPAAFVPMRLFNSELLPPVTKIPSSLLAEITLPAPLPVPPMVLKDPRILTPATWFPRLELPITSVPILLPWTKLPSPEMSMPSPLLPEITLPWPAPVPPIVLPELLIDTPSPLPRAMAPVASVPMKLPCTTLPVVPDPVIWMPSPPKRLITSPSTVQPPALINRPSVPAGVGAVQFDEQHRVVAIGQ